MAEQDLSQLAPHDLRLLVGWGDFLAAQELFRRCEPVSLSHAVELVVGEHASIDSLGFDATLDGFRLWRSEVDPLEAPPAV